MPTALFLDIIPSSPDDEMFPTEISWSLEDGQLKSVLILPDDDWEPWDNASYDTDVQHLIDHGETPSDIVKELNDDLSGHTVFVDGLDPDNKLLELLFESCDQEPDFEVAPITELFLESNLEELLHMRNEVAATRELDLHHCADTVRSLIFMAAERSGKEL
jgi:hypothetical protein